MEFTHFNKQGEAQMVDVSRKQDTYREAVAQGYITMNEECYRLAKTGTNKKGDILGVARIAGIMAMKKTADLIPLCHNIPISKAEMQFEYDDENRRIKAIGTVRTCDKTGVEMEAMTGVQIALLTIYDMCKAVDKFMVIGDVCLVRKSGGKSGLLVNPYVRNENKEPGKMRDSFNRTISYMRISITNHCNFHCKYCMPAGVSWEPNDSILTYDELLKICKVAVSKGIRHFKVTGGEPLLRQGCMEFLRKLKEMEGVCSVTLTTNGFLLAQFVEELAHIKVDSVNVSIDTLDEEQFDHLTGTTGNLGRILSAIDLLQAHHIKTKINVVLLKENMDQIIPLANLAKNADITVKFIEVMPIGLGRRADGMEAKEALSILKEKYKDLQEANEIKGNGPAVYYKTSELQGAIGIIHAVSNPFCKTCNRIRLTSEGILKPCLCYETGINLRELLRSGGKEAQLSQAFEQAIAKKPEAHCFSHLENITEHKRMNEIGG